MADPLFRNQGQKLAGGVPDPAQNGGVGKQKKKYPIPAQPRLKCTYLYSGVLHKIVPV
jgi:hypothetical protein